MRSAVFLASAFMVFLLRSDAGWGGVSGPFGLPGGVPGIGAGRIGQHGAALLAGPEHEVAVEGGDGVAEAALDVVAPELDLVQPSGAGRAEPGDPVELPLLARALDPQPDRAGWPARRVIHVLRQDEDLTLGDAQPALMPVLDHMDENVALELIEDLVERIDMEVIAG